MVFSTDDLLQLESASRTLLSPLAAPSVDEWRREATRSVASALHADSSLFGLPRSSSDSHAYFFSETLDSGVLQVIVDAVGDPNHFRPSRDPIVNLFFERRGAASTEVFDMPLIEQLVDHRQNESALYRDVWAPHRLTSAKLLHVRTPHGYASVQFFYDRDEHAFGASAMGLLRVLLPSFKAGLDALQRIGAHREALDAISEPVLVLQVDGRELHRNPALQRLVDADPERAKIESEIRRFVQRLRPLLYPRRSEQGTSAVALPEGSAQTVRGRYALRVAALASGAFGDEAILVSVRPEFPQFPSVEALRARHGLTRREAEVALLLAEGLRNEDIAARLYISAHTAKRHTEQVLGKLNVPSRKAIGLHLLQAQG